MGLAVLSDDSIEIYDYYLWTVYGVDDNGDSQFMYYKSRFKEDELIETRKVKEAFSEEEVIENDKTPEEMFKKGALYKHTFIKDNNGNYYWYNSVRIKEN